jgi:peptide deformylase
VTIRPIHLLGSPALREKSAAVGEVTTEVKKLVEDLFDTMRAADGIGLAANQIGLDTRVAVVDVEGDRIVLIDPEITATSGEDRAEEGCLSIPDIYGDVDRPMSVTVETTSLDGERISVDATELKARAIQHEIDHLDGVLFLDHLSPLRRRMLLKKWKKLRKDKPGFIEEAKQEEA